MHSVRCTNIGNAVLLWGSTGPEHYWLMLLIIQRNAKSAAAKSAKSAAAKSAKSAGMFFSSHFFYS